MADMQKKIEAMTQIRNARVIIHNILKFLLETTESGSELTISTLNAGVNTDLSKAANGEFTERKVRTPPSGDTKKKVKGRDSDTDTGMAKKPTYRYTGSENGTKTATCHWDGTGRDDV